MESEINREKFKHKKVRSYRNFQFIDKSNFEVYKVIDIEDNNIFKAIKVYPKAFLSTNPIWIPTIRSEVEILKKCRHQNIIHFYDFLETKNNFYLVMEYCKDGNLYNYVKSKGPLPEAEAVEIFKQILNGYHELYNQKVMHRDIKLSNILLNDSVVKIADFGFAKQGEISYSDVGTVVYKAPEIASQDYNLKVDIWSLGICFYELLFNKVPFNRFKTESIPLSSSKSLISQSIMSQPKNNSNFEEEKIDFPPNINISEECKEILQLMLQRDPKDRVDWVKLFSYSLFRNSLSALPYKRSDIFLLPIDPTKPTKQERKKEIIDLKNASFESEIDVCEDLTQKAMQKELELMLRKQEFKRLERRYLHFCNILRHMAFIYEKGLKIDQNIDEAIFLYTVFSKKLLLMSTEFIEKLRKKQCIFVLNEEKEVNAFEEFKNSLFCERFQQVCEEDCRNYERNFYNGVYQQFANILREEFNQSGLFFSIKTICQEKNPKESLINKIFLNLLQDYYTMKTENKALSDEKKKDFWIHLFFLYDCYDFWVCDYGFSDCRLKFDESFQEGFDFLSYREDLYNMKRFSDELSLKELIGKQLFI